MQEKNEVWKPGRRNTASRAWEPEPGCVAGYSKSEPWVARRIVAIRGGELGIYPIDPRARCSASRRGIPGATSTRDTRRGALQNEGARSALPNPTGAIGTGRVREAIGFAGLACAQRLLASLTSAGFPRACFPKTVSSTRPQYASMTFVFSADSPLVTCISGPNAESVAVRLTIM